MLQCHSCRRSQQLHFLPPALTKTGYTANEEGQWTWIFPHPEGTRTCCAKQQFSSASVELCRGGRGPETKRDHGGEYCPFGNLSADTELITSFILPILASTPQRYLVHLSQVLPTIRLASGAWAWARYLLLFNYSCRITTPMQRSEAFSAHQELDPSPWFFGLKVRALQLQYSRIHSHGSELSSHSASVPTRLLLLAAV